MDANSNRQFPEVVGTFCLAVNLKNYLQYQGIYLSESVMGAILSYMGFFFTTDQLKTREVIHGRNGSFSDMFARFQKRVLTPLQEKRYVSFNEALIFINACIEEKIFPIVWIDSFYMDHSEYFNKATYWTLVILLEFKEDKIIYFDNGIRRITIDKLMKACYRKEKYWIYAYQTSLPFKMELNVAIQQGITGIVNDFRKYNRIKEMHQFHAFLVSCNDQESMFNLYYQLSRPGGLPQTRYEISNFLKEYSYNCYSKYYQEMSEQWKIIANLLFKLSRNWSKKNKHNIVSRLEHVIAMEEKGIKLLSSVLVYK